VQLKLPQNCGKKNVVNNLPQKNYHKTVIKLSSLKKLSQKYHRPFNLIWWNNTMRGYLNTSNFTLALKISRAFTYQ
jgi:hypothetical protein